MNPIILHDNRFSDAAPTASATAEGFDARHIADRRTFTWWKGTGAGTFYLTVDCGAAASADALGIAGHNLSSAGATVQVQSSADGAEWTDRTAAIAPPNGDRPFLRIFPMVSAPHWRLKIVAADAAPEIAVVMIGRKMLFPFPPDTPYIPFTESVESDGPRSKAGHLLGETIRFFPLRISARFSTLERSWALGEYREFWEQVGRLRRQFFYAWDLDVFPEHVFFVKHRGDHGTPVSVASWVDNIRLDLEGIGQ